MIIELKNGSRVFKTSFEMPYIDFVRMGKHLNKRNMSRQKWICEAIHEKLEKDKSIIGG